jgi:2,5-diketo-D-gluconate reductase A
MAPHIIRTLAIISGLQFTLGFQSLTSHRHFLRTSSALSAAKNNDGGISLDRRSAIATTSAAVLTSLSITDPANALLPVGMFSSTRPRPSSTSGNSPSNRVIPTWKLDGGVEFPILALNTAGLSTEETLRAIDYAQNEGISHIDFHPGKERDGVAKYLKENKAVDRESLFLNTKIRKPAPGTSPEDAAKLARDQIEEDLQVLGVKYVDMLMLRDTPDPKNIQAQWKVLEEALAAGKTRSVGIINYCPSGLETLMQTAKVTPALNYIMCHVGMGPDIQGLRTKNEKYGIRTFSYGQTGEPEPRDALLNDPILKRIGEKHEKSTEEVALRWVLQNGMAASLRPSGNFGRCEGQECQMGLSRQVSCLEWELTKDEMAELDAIKFDDVSPTPFSACCPGSLVLKEGKWVPRG